MTATKKEERLTKMTLKSLSLSALHIGFGGFVESSADVLGKRTFGEFGSFKIF
uniref:Uncharacterized protein n=1 Tax=Solanum tuberosum TaxID=4113 RepID=M1C4Q5_SOLTU